MFMPKKNKLDNLIVRFKDIKRELQGITLNDYLKDNHKVFLTLDDIEEILLLIKLIENRISQAKHRCIIFAVLFGIVSIINIIVVIYIN